MSIIEDKPPVIRFVSTAEPDKVATDMANGNQKYMDVVYVYLRAPGDNKCEAKDVAKKTLWKPTVRKVQVEKPVVEFAEVDGEEVEVERTIKVEEERTSYTKETVYPWIESLKHRRKGNMISQDYFDFCMRHWQNFEQNQDAPIDGTPLAEWRGAPESVKRKAIDLGINSVEKAADMTEEAIRNIGMGARDMMNKAKAYLSNKDESVESAHRMTTLESENSSLKDQMSELEKKLEELAAQSQKKKPGRPPKKQEEAAA